MDEFHTTVDQFVMLRTASSRRLLINKIDEFLPDTITEFPNHDGMLFTLVDRLSFKQTEDENILLSAYNKAPNSVFSGKDKHKRTMLQKVIQEGCSCGIVQLTLERSPESHQLDHDKGGNTVMHYAARRADVSIITLLINNMNQRNTIQCMSKRNKGGRTPLFEIIDSSPMSTTPIHRIMSVSDTKTVWESKDKTGRLPIERVTNGTFELYGDFINRMTSPHTQFYNKNISILQCIIRDQNTISVSNVVNIAAALIVYNPVFLHSLLADTRSVRGICDDIFTQIIQKSQYPSLAFKLLNAMAMSELRPIMLQKRDIWEQTIFHIAAYGFHELIHCIRSVAPTGLDVKDCLMIYSLKGTPMHIVIKEGSTYDFETKMDMLRQECTEQFMDHMIVIPSALTTKDIHGKYAFEYAKSMKIIEVLFPYLKGHINTIAKEVLYTAARVHSYPVFMETIEMTNINPVSDDKLLSEVARKNEIVVTVRPRQVFEYMINAIHPITPSESTLHHIISIAATLASSARDADKQLVQSIMELKEKWYIWRRWKRIQEKVKIKAIYHYWNEISLQKYYLPDTGVEFLLSLENVYNNDSFMNLTHESFVESSIQK
ncbi:hypothetical protein EXVG_00311 [Emiliania huxleyi virus 202]|nr:hypothetical protein EXVG_00311 [Emiliania huxleyi virus 202]AHA54241.1 hypothetical protein EhV18_00194 [Emiliania huxleyi virus 18]